MGDKIIMYNHDETTEEARILASRMRSTTHPTQTALAPLPC
jgi:hypothetical protein